MFFLIIRGPLESGKSAVLRAVAIALRARVVPIDEILERFRWDGGSLRLFLRANRIAAQHARRHLAHGVPVVIDGNFYWKRAIDDLLRRLPYPSVVFSLKVPLRVCIERDRGRALSYGAEATRQVYAKVNRFEIGIPVDGTPPLAEVVQRIRRTVRGPGVLAAARSGTISSRTRAVRPRFVRSGAASSRGGRTP